MTTPDEREPATHAMSFITPEDAPQRPPDFVDASLGEARVVAAQWPIQLVTRVSAEPDDEDTGSYDVWVEEEPEESEGEE